MLVSRGKNCALGLECGRRLLLKTSGTVFLHTNLPAGEWQLDLDNLITWSIFYRLKVKHVKLGAVLLKASQKRLSSMNRNVISLALSSVLQDSPVKKYWNWLAPVGRCSIERSEIDSSNRVFFLVDEILMYYFLKRCINVLKRINHNKREWMGKRIKLGYNLLRKTDSLICLKIPRPLTKRS